MRAKQNPCTLGAKHKWGWVKNITLTSVTYSSRGSRATVSLRGLYTCACGGERIGKDNPNGADLRGVSL